MALNTTQGIFQIKPLLQNIEIELCSRSENGVKQILALVTSDGDIVLHYTYGELAPVLKIVPWYSDNHKRIRGICFDPSATWLLVISVDCSLYIIPALNLVDKKQKIDCKWSLNDVTHFPKHAQTPEAKPTSIVWWQTLDCNQNALVGFENGAVVLISLTDGRCLGSCSIPVAVKHLHLCKDNSLEIVSLLIHDLSGQQYRLVLEHRSTGYLWPPEAYTQTEDSTRSRLYNLKQMGVDKFVSLKQRLSEARGGRRDSQTSDTASESSHSESVHSTQSGPELLPHLCDTDFSPQYARSRYLFSALYKPTSLLTVHAVDVESAPLYVHKLPQNTTTVLLTDRLMYTVNEDANIVSIISSQLSECRLEGDSDFNSDSLVAQFRIHSGKILKVFKLVDLSSVRLRKNRGDNKKDKLFELPKTVDDLNIQKPRIDTCVIVTDNCVYKVVVSCSPITKFVEYVTEEGDLEKAEKISIIFSLNIQQLLESCGDLLISRGAYHSGIILYKQAKVHLLKRVLKLAVSAECKVLLKFIHLCLGASKVDMSLATKIHTGNLAVMAYTELILRFGGPERISNTEEFMKFLCHEEHYDQILAVNVACQAGQWNIVAILAKSRGLQPEVVAALGQILQSAKAPKPSEHDFLYALSEPSLTQSLLIDGQSSQFIFKYIRANVNSYPVEILRRLAIQLDPSQPSSIPLVCRLLQTTKSSSSLDTTIESVDSENPDRSVVIVKDFIDTFLTVVIHLVRMTEKLSFDLSLLDAVEPPKPPPKEPPIMDTRMPELHHLGCGYEHAAVIRNHDVYTMGVSSSGCLGLGPHLTHTSPPRLVSTLSELKVKALKVACGRKHTLVLTDFGLYSWGSNRYGQLGLGPHIQETPYATIVSSLASEKLIDIDAGQYHSIALTADGRCYTWGWGFYGQLGHGVCDNEFYPKDLNFGYPLRQVSAGLAHSLILSIQGIICGFGSNLFGQLGFGLEATKSAKPVWVRVTDMDIIPYRKVSTAYFHNLAHRIDDEMFVFGANPQEVRLYQSKQKHSGSSPKPADGWKNSVLVYTPQRPIEQISIGYKHQAMVDKGRLLCSKAKEKILVKLNVDYDEVGLIKYLHVGCGLDYTMAIDFTGKVLAWGNSSMAQTLLGCPEEDDNKNQESKFVLCKNTRRIIKLPNTKSSSIEKVEVPGLPSMAITFSHTDHSLLFSRNFLAHSIRLVENDVIPIEKSSGSGFSHIYESPNFKFSNKTLHYVLETYYGFYDTDAILSKCLEVQNYQAAAKIAFLDGHFGDSLGFLLIAFKKHMESLDLKLQALYTKKNSVGTREKDQGYVELIVRNIQEDLNERNLNRSTGNMSPGHILSSSSSLDSIRHWGDEMEHQGGCESPCEVSEMDDIRQNISEYVQSLTNPERSPPISSVSKMVSEIDNVQIKLKDVEPEYEIKDETAKEVIDAASRLVEFYIRKIYLSENHILMQNVLMKCIEFWLSNNLPVPVLESVLLENMDKYFYPLSILLFCKNFDGDIVKERPKSSGFLKQFSAKFCLQLCSMVLENVNKS